MTATPRAVSSAPRIITARTPRPVAPRNLRLRQLSGVNVRPFGTISLFIYATLILGATSLLYLWQNAQTMEMSLNIPRLQLQYIYAQNQYQDLKQQEAVLTSPARVMDLATRKYGLVRVDPSTARVVTVPQPAKVRVVVVPDKPRQPSASVRLSSTGTTIGSWWQDAWSLLYSVMH